MTADRKAMFVVPCYYVGTSFERIASAITYVIKEHNLPIDLFIGEAYQNTLNNGSLDDERYTKSQARMISGIVDEVATKGYERVLFIDFFNPGMELLQYMSDQTGKSVKMASMLHGATFVPGDIYDSQWVQRAEMLWCTLYDKIYVPSAYALSQLPEEFSVKSSVYPWGMDDIIAREINTSYDDRKTDVIFPHRLNADKGIDDLEYIINNLPELSFTITVPQSISKEDAIRFGNLANVTIEVCKTTDDLYEVMSDAKIILSCAKQELFGYSVAEAVALGCVPVVPKGQVYTELYDDIYAYKNIDECIELIKKFASQKLDSGQQATHLSTSFLPMLNNFLSM